MTKEELEKEAEEYIDKLTKDWSDGEYSFSVEELRQAIFHFAEPREKRIAELEAQIEKMKKYIKACWVEENLNDYSSYNTNCSDEFRDLVKELNEELEKATGKELIEERDYCGCLRNY